MEKQVAYLRIIMKSNDTLFGGRENKIFRITDQVIRPSDAGHPMFIIFQTF